MDLIWTLLAMTLVCGACGFYIALKNAPQPNSASADRKVNDVGRRGIHRYPGFLAASLHGTRRSPHRT